MKEEVTTMPPPRIAICPPRPKPPPPPRPVRPVKPVDD